jgi:SAM-dependent methyltransferase
MSQTAVEPIKVAHRATWAAGDYAAVAELIDEIPPRDLLERVPVKRGQSVLDVATGTGNVALKAAAAGANVVGLDLAPELFHVARRRAAELGVDVDWVAGDAEALPYDNDRFDRVFSVFGVQFAPRHQVTAAELVRVCRPGGQIGVVNWTPESPVGEMFAILSAYLPAPPAFASPPPLWGDETHVRELFAGTPVELEFSSGSTPFEFDNGDHFVDFFETHYGPLVKARERLTAEGRWQECRTRIARLMDEHSVVEGRLDAPSEYLITVAHKNPA